MSGYIEENKLSLNNYQQNNSVQDHENNDAFDEIIYFVAEEPFSEMVKIGKTTNMVNRLSGMQTGNPRKLNVMLKFHRPKKYDYERLFHKLFFEKCILGEWYKINMKILRRIEIIMKTVNRIDEINILINEFLRYDTEFFVDEDKIYINSPPNFDGRCGSKLHIPIKTKKQKWEQISISEHSDESQLHILIKSKKEKKTKMGTNIYS